MGFTLDQVVPWGRNLAEYQRIFSLSEDDLNLKILGCADGPASVNAELHRKGKAYVSLDPIYKFSAQQIKERITATTPVIAEQLKKNKDDYLWDYYRSPNQLIRIRQSAMGEFLRDFDQSFNSERYIASALPTLPFGDHTFDLALCSYFLFSYSEQLNEEFHRQSMLDMARVAREVRVFPLLEISGERSRHLSGVLSSLKNENLSHRIVPVDYEFQKGGNQMLILYTP